MVRLEVYPHLRAREDRALRVKAVWLNGPAPPRMLVIACAVRQPPKGAGAACRPRGRGTACSLQTPYPGRRSEVLGKCQRVVAVLEHWARSCVRVSTTGS